MARLDARSWPSGFSSTSRVLGVFSPAAASCSHATVNSDGAVARYMTTVSGVALAQQGREPLVVLRLRQVHPQEMQQRGETVELLRRGALGQLHFVEARANQRAVLRVAQVVAGDADDAAAGRQRAVAKGLEQRGHQLAPGQVAGAAEEDEVEAHGSIEVGTIGTVT